MPKLAKLHLSTFSSLMYFYFYKLLTIGKNGDEQAAYNNNKIYTTMTKIASYVEALGDTAIRSAVRRHVEGLLVKLSRCREG